MGDVAETGGGEKSAAEAGVAKVEDGTPEAAQLSRRGVVGRLHGRGPSLSPGVTHSGPYTGRDTVPATQ